MVPAIIAQAATPTGGLDLNWVVALGTAAAALGGWLGAWVIHRQGRTARRAQDTSDLQGRVTKEVEAKLGTVLMSLRELEADARTRLEDVTQTFDHKERELSASVEAKESALRAIVDRSTAQAQQIEDLIKRATDLIPALQASEAIPIQLLALASNSTDAATVTALLLRVLDHTEADARVLELSGDIARQELSNNSLAERLYSQSLMVDPERLSARAEYLSLKAYRSAERAEARLELVELAKQNPNDATVVNAMLNFFIRTGDYEGLLIAASDLLKDSRQAANLWRNIAVAKANLDKPPDEVEEAYENALKLGDEGQYTNAARPYVRYLIDHKDFARASAVLKQAILYDASEGELHYLRGELLRKEGDMERAQASYELCVRVGDQSDQMMASRSLRRLAILAEVDLDGMQ